MFNLISIDPILLSLAGTEFLQQTVLGYLGPGAAISTIGTFIVVLLAVVVAALGFVWYPLKRMLGKKKLQEPDAVLDHQE